MKRNLLSNMSWLAVANILTKPIWFVFITAICMRQLGVAEYGVMTVALALGMTVTGLTDLGATRYSVREIAKDRSLAPSIAANFISAKIVLLFFALVVSVITGMAIGLGPSALPGLLAATAYAMGMQLLNYCRGFYQAFANLKLEAISLLSEKITVIALGLTGLFLFRSAEATLSAMAIGMVLCVLTNIVWVNRNLFRISLASASLSFFKGKIPALASLGLLGFLGIAYLRVDLVMLEAMKGSLASGQYGAAFRILEAMLVVPAIVSIAATYPRLSSHVGRNEQSEFSKLVKVVTAGIFLVGLSSAIVVHLFAERIVVLIDPNPLFEPTGQSLKILVATFPLMCINSVLHSAMLALSKERIMLVVLIIGLSTNVALNLLWIPASGIFGASWATVVAEVVVLAVLTLTYLATDKSTFSEQFQN
ncbi:MAG: oligosaccharide flippase family protein [Rhodothermales bacterium]|nr:oligosaccharide flippase family protein [Rhodothermales bacterium]